ncbi:MAG: DUF885 domain-containing protein [Theionarchaea archaeon]|nr:DUF885 domain-containing protein [Theionarchaea archaeon]MBU7020269.1 DUF885 domain-containing protein [Theionarchaea archaeon]
MTPLKEIEEAFFETRLGHFPYSASLLGYTEYDTLMPSGTLSAYEKIIEQDREFLCQFEDLDESQMDFGDKITKRVAVHQLEISLFIDEVLHHYRKNPDCAIQVSDALTSLFTRRTSDRFYPILARLEKSPQFITEFRTRVITPVPLWRDVAIESAERLILLLKSICEAASKEIPPQDAEEIRDRALAVETHIKEYSTFLKGLAPSDISWAIDKEDYDTLLSLRKLPYTGDQILALGWKWYDEEKKRLAELASRIAPGTSVDYVMNSIKERHPPTFEDVLELYRTCVKKSRQFIIDHDVLTLPEGEHYEVDVMPIHLRHILPLAACFPAPVVGDERVGYLRVTPHDDPAFLREHSEPFIINGCVHEGYPGHHVQLWCSGTHPDKVRWALISGFSAKMVCSGPEMVEGWAHYCEELMMNLGFCNTLELQFIQSRDVLWRAIRIIVDVSLSRGEMGFEEGVAFLMDMGMERPAAEGEVTWYSLLPTYPLSYLLGKNLLKDLKARVKAKMGSSYTDKFFHDTVLYEGTMPLALLEEVFNNKIRTMST